MGQAAGTLAASQNPVDTGADLAIVLHSEDPALGNSVWGLQGERGDAHHPLHVAREARRRPAGWVTGLSDELLRGVRRSDGFAEGLGPPVLLSAILGILGQERVHSIRLARSWRVQVQGEARPEPMCP